MKKFIAGFVGLAMVATVALPANAQTVAELTAQINSLLATISQLQAQLSGMSGGTTGGAVQFNTDLTIGSTGADVTALQMQLVAGGYLQMPAGVAYGYFGPLTRSALAAWQAANGISPAVGYFGPISRARLNSMMPATPGTPGTPTTPGSGITTPGVEGTLTVSLNPTPGAGTKVYAGDSQVPVLGIELEAKLSDIRVERVKLNLGSNTTLYNRVADQIHLSDGSNVLATMDLNSNTVVKEGSNYFITITGFDLIVPKDATRVLVVHVSAYNNINFAQVSNGSSHTITVPVDGVRGIDGAGINQYGPGSAFSRSFTINQSLTETAELKVSQNTNTPKAGEVVAAGGSTNDELDELTLLAFDVRAEKDDVLVTDVVATITRGGNTSTATSSVAYLYDGSTLIGSATVEATSATAMTATFDDIDYTVPRDSTRVLTLRVDIRDAGAAATTFVASVTGGSVTAENTIGDNVTPTGTATGNTMTVRNVGPEFTLVSKTIEKSATAQQENTSTSTAKGTFNVRVKAVGGDLTFGTQASTSAARMFAFGTYQGSTLTALNVASSSSFNTPSSGVIAAGSNSFTLQENNEVTIPVEFIFEGREVSSALVSTNTYAIGIEAIRWSPDLGATTQSSTFMAGELDWRTSGVSLP